MKRNYPFLFLLIVALLLSSCARPTPTPAPAPTPTPSTDTPGIELNDKQIYRLLNDEQILRIELVKEIKAFENKLGFNETENFKYYFDRIEAYDYYYYTPKTVIPYSFEDPLLKWGVGRPGTVSIDLEKHDVFFYSTEAIAGAKTPVTKSLLRAPLPRFIHIVFHEDWHEQLDLPRGIEEPSAEVVSYVAAMLFVREKFGESSEIYKTLEAELENHLKESRIYNSYYGQLETLYGMFQLGKISEEETLSRKVDLLQSMGRELELIWGGRPDQLNNAFIAFQMTYFRHFPLMYRIFLATDANLIKTMEIFRLMPNKGVKFRTVEELKKIEKEIADFLGDVLQGLRESDLVKL